MAERAFVNKHNMIARLNNAEDLSGLFHPVMNMLRNSRISHLFMESPILYLDYLTQFYQTATVNEVAGQHASISATVGGQNMTFTARQLREILHLGTEA